MKQSFQTLAWLAGSLMAGLSAAQAPKPDAAEAAAAMERAQRLAGSPMRVILQAGKIRRKAPEPDAGTDTRLAENKTVPAEPAAVMLSLRSDALPVPAAGALPAPPLERAGGVEPALAPMQPLQVLPKAAPPLAALVAVPAPPQAAVPVPVPVPAQAPAPQPSLQPRLVSMVEPQILQRVMDSLGRAVEVAVDITIQPDGSVSSAAVQQPAPRPLVRPIVEAVMQWRFEPMAGARAHRVQMVFNDR